MAKKQFVIGAGALAIVFGLALGVTSGFTFSQGSPVSAQVQPDNSAVPGPHTNAAIESIRAELDSVTQYESAYGCLTFGRGGQSEFCGASKERIGTLESKLTEEVHKLELSDRSSEALAQVRSNIESLAERKADVTFEGTSANPYTNAVKRIEQWQDDKGFLYIVNPTNNAVVQFGPGPGSKIPFERDGSKSLPQSELKAMAEEYLSKHVADFDSVKANFSSRQMSKPGSVSYAFRWEAKSKPQGEDVTPFVQIVLSPVGEVMSFNDVRSLYSN